MRKKLNEIKDFIFDDEPLTKNDKLFYFGLVPVATIYIIVSAYINFGR